MEGFKEKFIICMNKYDIVGEELCEFLTKNNAFMTE